MFVPTHKHKKTGRLYQRLFEARHTETGESLTVYVGTHGEVVWARPEEMFFDGRFEEEPAPILEVVAARHIYYKTLNNCHVAGSGLDNCTIRNCVLEGCVVVD